MKYIIIFLLCTGTLNAGSGQSQSAKLNEEDFESFSLLSKSTTNENKLVIKMSLFHKNSPDEYKCIDRHHTTYEIVDDTFTATPAMNGTKKEPNSISHLKLISVAHAAKHVIIDYGLCINKELIANQVTVSIWSPLEQKIFTQEIDNDFLIKIQACLTDQKNA